VPLAGVTWRVTAARIAPAGQRTIIIGTRAPSTTPMSPAIPRDIITGTTTTTAEAV